MDRLVDEYLQACAEAEEPITLTGMILHLGLSSRQSLDRYADRPEFSDAVKRAKLAIEHEYERRLDRTHPSGAIFALKNMGWSDRQVVEVGASLTSLDLTRLPDDLLQRVAEGEHPMTVLVSALEGGLSRDELLRLPPASSGGARGDGEVSG